jgi:hypothetical protein
MDATAPKYSKSRYDEFVKEVSSYKKEVGTTTTVKDMDSFVFQRYTSHRYGIS